MKFVIVASCLRVCSQSLFLRPWRNKRDPVVAPIPRFRARDAWRVNKLGNKLDNKRNIENLMSFGVLSGQLSSVFDGTKDE